MWLGMVRTVDVNGMTMIVVGRYRRNASPTMTTAGRCFASSRKRSRWALLTAP